MPSHRPSLAIPYTCLASSMVLVGVYVALSKPLVAFFPVMLLAWFRFGIAAVAMGGWLRRAPTDRPLTSLGKRLLFLESFLGNFLFSVCMLTGVKYTSALAAGVIMAGIPAAVALFSRIFLGERIAPRVQMGIACAVGGIVLLTVAKALGVGLPKTASGPAAPHALLGNILLVGAVCCEASYVIIGKKLTGDLSAKRISALVNLWGWTLATPFGLWYLLHGFDFAAIPWTGWALLVFYALAASMITVWLWMTGLKSVPAASAGVFTALLPISAAAIGVFFLGETFTPVHALAFALALTGVMLATWPSRPRG